MNKPTQPTLSGILAPPLTGIVLAFALAAATAGLSPGAAMASDDPERRPVLACREGLCLLSLDTEGDSDGDGWSDEDEKALDTDPRDANRRPAVLSALDLISDSGLPSFERGLTEVVVLPTMAPDGSALSPGWSMPVRTSALDRLGLSSDLLGKLGLDDGSAIRVSTALATLGGGEKGPSVRVAGIPVGLVSAGGSGPINVATYLDLVERGGVDDRTSTGLSVEAGKRGAVRVRDGYTNGWSSTATLDGRGGGTLEVYDEDLYTKSTHTTTAPATSKNADGSTTSSQTETSSIPGGGPRGEDVETVTTTSTTRKPDGTSETAKVKVTVWKEQGKAVHQEVTTTVATQDKDGNTTSSSTTNVICDGQGESCSTVKAHSKGGGYYNPDADDYTNPAWVTPETVDRVTRMLGSVTTPGPEVQVTPEGVVPTGGPADPTIILIDPDAAAEADFRMFTSPSTGRTQPRYDPNLPSVLGAFGA